MEATKRKRDFIMDEKDYIATLQKKYRGRHLKKSPYLFRTPLVLRITAFIGLVSMIIGIASGLFIHFV